MKTFDDLVAWAKEIRDEFEDDEMESDDEVDEDEVDEPEDDYDYDHEVSESDDDF